MEKVIESIKNVFHIPDLRNRVLFTLGILFLYRLGCQVIVPGVDSQAIRGMFEAADNNMLNMVNMFSGGALANAAVFALGIMPYITASIILQILQKSVPYLERLSKEGEQGRNKINRYTRYLTVVFGILHSYGITQVLLGYNSEGNSLLSIPGDSLLYFHAVVMITLTTGAVVIMWLGEKITENGIGNGISLIIYASIVVTIPSALMQLYELVRTNAIGPAVTVLVLALIIGTVIFVVFFELGVRRITIQYAKRATPGGQTAAGTTGHLPFKVNSAGVIPVIFSASILQLPGIVQQWVARSEEPPPQWLTGLLDSMAMGTPLNNLLFFAVTMFFTFFYVEMLFNPKDTAENLKKHGGFIPGIRPGKETQAYIEGVLTRLTFWGGLYLSVVSIVPTVLMSGLKLNTLPAWLGGNLFDRLPAIINQGSGVTLAYALGGTSLLIVVSVALDFVTQVENQLIMHKYDGFTSNAKSRAKASGSRRYA